MPGMPGRDGGAYIEGGGGAQSALSRVRIALLYRARMDYIGRMGSGRINSPASIRTANDVFRAFGGSWEAVESASHTRADGVHVIRRSDIQRARRDRNEQD